MKKLLIALVTLLPALGGWSQSLIKGDMDGNGQVTIADVTAVVNTALGRMPLQTFDVASGTVAVNNSQVAGAWYAPDGTALVFNADGTTSYGSGYTYKYVTGLQWLLIIDATGNPAKLFLVQKPVAGKMILVDQATNQSTTYVDAAYRVSSINIEPASVELYSGETQQLAATVAPSQALTKSVTWASSDEGVATVSASGMVTAIAGGNCTITATAQDGTGVVGQCRVTVIQRATGITLNPSECSIVRQSGQRLEATVLPANTSNRAVVWTSSDESVATISDHGDDWASVWAVNVGTCIVTATAQDGSGVSAQCTVRVYKDDSGAVGDYNYIDLCLPSGTMWAECNFGASSPEQYGNRYSWGSQDESGYTWASYFDTEDGGQTFLKYNTPTNEAQNECEELDLADDIASTYYPGYIFYRTPSAAQWRELQDECDWTYEELNGVRGARVTSRVNGRSIFLPANGQYNGEVNPDYAYEYCNQTGYYWTRSRFGDGTTQAREARAMSFALNDNNTFSSATLVYSERRYGMAIRPVRYAAAESLTLSHTFLSALATEGIEQRIAATVLPATANQAVHWESSDPSVATVTQTGFSTVVRSTGKAGMATITATAKYDDRGRELTAQCYVLVYGEASGRQDGHIYIDMGLPSGTKWAATNLGAERPEDWGNYYAWGETETKKTYSFATYKYAYNPNDIYSGYTKYILDSNSSHYDGLSQLTTGDDAAFQNWGSHWRMPTKEQMAELTNTDYVEWSIIKLYEGTGNDRWYQAIKSKFNGNMLLLPFAGYYSSAANGRWEGGLLYWSRSLWENNLFASWLRWYDLEQKNIIDGMGREDGMPVRPVLNPTLQ